MDNAHGRAARHVASTGTAPGAGPPWAEEELDPVRPSLSIDRIATARNVTEMRRAFARWLALDVAAGDLFDDIVLVAYEALANVVDHAYAHAPGGPGTVLLTAHRASAELRVTVTDHGSWRAPTGEPFRNRGLSVLRALSDQVHIDTTAAGTVVILRCALPEPVRRPARPGVGINSPAAGDRTPSDPPTRPSGSPPGSTTARRR